MNRRFFLSTLSALVASPALPARTTPIASQHMSQPKLSRGYTTDMLMRHLRVPADMAARIQAQLLRQSVITPPLAGVSMGTNPSNTACITNKAMKPINLLQKAADLRRQLEKLDEHLPEKSIKEQRGNPHLPDIRMDNRSNNPSTS